MKTPIVFLAALFAVLALPASAKASFETRGFTMPTVETYPLLDHSQSAQQTQPAQPISQPVQSSTQPIPNAPQYVIQAEENTPTTVIQAPTTQPPAIQPAQNPVVSNVDQSTVTTDQSVAAMDQPAVSSVQNLPPLSPYPPSAPPPPMPANFTVQPVQNNIPPVQYAVIPAQQSQTSDCNCANPCAPKVVYQQVAAAPLPPPQPTISKEDRTVYFGFNKTNLDSEAKAKLNSLATRIISSENVTGAQITGYADRIGTTTYNEKLSQKRAENVRSYLVDRGFIKPMGTTTKWVGKSQAAAKCSKYMPRAQLLDCLQPDRKVEVQIEYRNSVVAGR